MYCCSTRHTHVNWYLAGIYEDSDGVRRWSYTTTAAPCPFVQRLANDGSRGVTRQGYLAPGSLPPCSCTPWHGVSFWPYPGSISIEPLEVAFTHQCLDPPHRYRSCIMWGRTFAIHTATTRIKIPALYPAHLLRNLATSGSQGAQVGVTVRAMSTRSTRYTVRIH